MAVTKASNSSLLNKSPKYTSFLAGNPAFIPNSFESIATFTANGTTTSYTFTSIPSTYKSLQLRINVLGTDGDSIQIGFNNDTTTNYVYHRLSGTGTAAASGNSTGVSWIPVSDASYQGINPTYPTPIIVDITDYSSSSKYKTVRSFTGIDKNGSGVVVLSSGLWLNTSAISTIIVYGFSNLNSGTTIALYGIKGA